MPLGCFAAGSVPQRALSDAEAKQFCAAVDSWREELARRLNDLLGFKAAPSRAAAVRKHMAFFTCRSPSPTYINPPSARTVSALRASRKPVETMRRDLARLLRLLEHVTRLDCQEIATARLASMAKLQAALALAGLLCAGEADACLATAQTREQLADGIGVRLAALDASGAVSFPLRVEDVFVTGTTCELASAAELTEYLRRACISLLPRQFPYALPSMLPQGGSVVLASPLQLICISAHYDEILVELAKAHATVLGMHSALAAVVQGIDELVFFGVNSVWRDAAPPERAAPPRLAGEGGGFAAASRRGTRSRATAMYQDDAVASAAAAATAAATYSATGTPAAAAAAAAASAALAGERPAIVKLDELTAQYEPPQDAVVSENDSEPGGGGDTARALVDFL